MTHVFEGVPDSRQMTGVEATVSRFRPRYRGLSETEMQLHDDIKSKAQELEALFNKVKTGRYHSLALTDLELSVMWIIKELTS